MMHTFAKKKGGHSQILHCLRQNLMDHLFPETHTILVFAEMNVRAANQNTDKHKSRTFRERLFGTKPRAEHIKTSGSQGQWFPLMIST